MSQADKQNTPKRRPFREFLAFMAVNLGGMLILEAIPLPWNILAVPIGFLLVLFVLMIIYRPRRSRA